MQKTASILKKYSQGKQTGKGLNIIYIGVQSRVNHFSEVYCCLVTKSSLVVTDSSATLSTVARQAPL